MPDRAIWFLSVLATIIASVLVAPSAVAQDDPITVETQIETTRFYVGDAVRLIVVVDGTTDPTPPTLNAPDGLSLAYKGGNPSSSSFVQIVNGRRTERRSQRYRHEYAVTAQRPGRHIIPPATVDIGGVTYSTRPTRVEAVEAAESTDFRLVAEIERDTVYVGQPVRMTITWYVVANPTRVTFGASRLPPSFDVHGIQRAQRAGGPQLVELNIFGQTLTGEVGRERVSGTEFTTVTMELSVVPRQVGSFELGPIVVVFDRGGRGFRNERQTSRSEPVSVTVLDVPNKGRPPNWSGLIGRYAVGSRASHDEVNVGDPIELEVVVRGTDAARSIGTGPDLATQPDFASGFKMSPDGWRRNAGNGAPDQIAFKTTIRAASDAVDEIPGIEIPYFDPVAGAFDIARSQPIPLDVQAVREVTSADAVVGPNFVGSVRRSPLELADPGIWAPDDVVLAEEGLHVWKRLGAPAWIVLLVAPPGLWLAGGIARYRAARTDPKRQRRNRALARARHEMSRAGPAEGIRSYLADVLGCAREAVTRAEVERVLGHEGVAGCEGMAELLARHEASRYAKTEGPPREAQDPPDRRAAFDLLKRVDRELRRAR